MGVSVHERAGDARAEGDPRTYGPRPMRVAVVGVSARPVCGARDHAERLARSLQEQGITCSMHWLERSGGQLGASAREVRAWTRGLPEELERSGAEAVIFHYSVFSYAYRGLPVLVRPVLAALGSCGVPVLAILHEFAFPWRQRGLRGKVWAATQRVAFVGVMRRSGAVVVTTDERQDWLRTRRWLPRRPVAVAPVFSNLPEPRAGARPREGSTVGVFGYYYGRHVAELVLDALGLAGAEHGELRLALLGAPGADSAEGRLWLEEARRRGLGSALAFSGTIPAQELADALASCEVLVFADPSGPSSRKTSLAACLASARPVLAFDGSHRWQALLDEDALQLVQPSAEALARGLLALLADSASADALGARGREFASRRMSLAHTAEVVDALLESLLRA